VFELPDVGDALAALPCLWKRLRKRVSKKRPRSDAKVHVNDSKQVYSPALGLKALERGVVALAQASGYAIDDLRTFLVQVAPHVLDDLPAYPWYDTQHDRFPIDNDAVALRLLGNALKVEMQRVRTTCVRLAARVVLERQLNRMIASTNNKASVLFSTAAIHIDQLLTTYGSRGLLIFCDRQGGRGHYGSLLRLMFEEWELEVTSELESRSEYRLHRRGDVVRIIFTEKAEEQCLPVALASMLSKYLREALMHRFNSYWKSHLPALEPTAGYYNDGLRFLRDIASKRVELGIADDQLVRCR
jgi:hypothetical protein